MATPASRPPASPAPSRQPVKNYVTPKDDVVFYVMRDSNIPVNQTWSRGELFKDRPDYQAYSEFRDYLLCHVEPADESGWQKWWYAAPRSEQDAYNYDIRDCKELVRSYVVVRGETPANGGAPEVPDGGTEDAAFPAYGFVGVSIKSPGDPLAGIFDVVHHRYAQKVTVDEQYDARLDGMVTITKTVIAKGSGTASYTTGQVVEIQDGNACHDVSIETTCATGDRALPTLPSFSNYNFPSKLNSINLVVSAAYADSDQAARSYSEDYYFRLDISEPRPGPYAAKIYRTVTADPDSILSGITLATVPQPKRESIGVAYFWYHASPKGNRTQAVAREYMLPATVHGDVEITFNNATLPPNATRTINGGNTTISATPGFTGNISGEIAVDAEVIKLPLGMYEVRITVLDLTTPVYA